MRYPVTGKVHRGIIEVLDGFEATKMISALGQ
jgi:hypothetical protein